MFAAVEHIPKNSLIYDDKYIKKRKIINLGKVNSTVVKHNYCFTLKCSFYSMPRSKLPRLMSSQVSTVSFGVIQGYCRIVTYIDMTTLLYLTVCPRQQQNTFFLRTFFVISLMHWVHEVSHFSTCTVVKITFSAHTLTRYNTEKPTTSDLTHVQL